MAATIALLAVLVPSVSAASPRSGDLLVTKECSAYKGQAGGYSTITSSNVPQIKVGSKVVYLQALTTYPVLDTDTVLDTPDHGEDMAFGHVLLTLPAGPGLVTFSGGIGRFDGFTATLDVTPNPAEFEGWFWKGSYSFSPAD